MHIHVLAEFFQYFWSIFCKDPVPNIVTHVQFVLLKVVGNEKLGGLKFLQLLGIGLGPWRSISILILNVPFANTKRISVSGLSSNMNRR